MSAPRNRKHILVPGPPEAQGYKPHGRKIEVTRPVPPTSRAKHGKALERALKAAVVEADKRRAEAGIEVHGAVPGLYVQFESQPGVPLQVTSLEDSRQGIEVVAVSQSKTDEPQPRRVERATVFVPDGKVKHFLKRFESYAKTTPKKERERRYEDMLDPVSTLRLATLRSLWTDATEAYPGENETIWWEVWLRRQDGDELERLMEFAAAQEIDVALRRLMFDDRIVTLVRATAPQLAASIDVLNDVAEVRKAKEAATVFVGMGPEDQGEWMKELRARVTPPAADAPAVCVLDTGVTRAHPLLDASLDVDDCHTCEPAWGTHDHLGHGTEMAGLALYGDLTPVLAGTQNVVLRHRLESVKILPPDGYPANPPELYGAVTAEAASRAEIQAPERQRTFSMSIAATDERDRGQPTSWSAAVDALAAGRSFDPGTQGLDYLDESDAAAGRLFVLCAGNVDETSLSVDHLERSATEPIHDPGQAWNALTVGAFTEKVVINDPKWTSSQPVARPGELSPWSTTGVTFADAWPIKPDVVFEGGNVVKNAKGEVDFPCPDLSLLSTYFQPADKSLVLSWATSAATAQAARLAALISAEYPTYWPETLRALVVHSAEWSAQMQTHLRGASGKRARAKLVQRYGFGVPSAERALRSANDVLTLVAQSDIRPFTEGKMRELHFFDLPWPRDVLAQLAATPVRLRITLSYFIEPNPGRRGWKKRHRYASHGLRFDVKGPTESIEEFRKRLNKKALEEDEARPTTGGDSSEWYLGEQARNRGSLHSDILSCNAADLAERGVIAVYPVSGWWKDQPKRDRSDKGARYALVVSIETPGVETDIWTPVAEQVGLPIAIEL
ncbi:S8 family peptidase [Corallococcus exiguus]|uniref:S8 family serine peptidase n=1 Tax=Corallococcus exiguus TaxID=83462 RepID=UPI001470997D|nr:S8 family peptidase [Corallococcus exiguus]NNB96192.1 S8 family peptidase [Corallococcus exiguus]NNC02459.1 S8 family peptidase [Corallococcus exiguus]